MSDRRATVADEARAIQLIIARLERLPDRSLILAAVKRWCERIDAELDAEQVAA